MGAHRSHTPQRGRDAATGSAATSWAGRVGRAVVAVLVVPLVVAASSPLPAAASGVEADDWLGVVNAYRAMSGLDPVVENPTWSSEAREHSAYMLLNGITHEQTPGAPGYSVGGNAAGSNGNVATSSNATASPRRFVELWMTGPFHAIGLLRHNLTSTGFGLVADRDTSPWRSAATLDVLRGLSSGTRRDTATVFPGRASTVPLDRFVAEHPDPVQLVGWTGPAGLPLIAMMPTTVSSATAALSGPSGAIETRVLHPGDPGSGPGADLARQVMASENAVVVVPRDRLERGRHHASVQTDAGSVSWSFTVDPDTPLLAAAPAAHGSDVPSTSPAATPVGPTGAELPVTWPLAAPAGFVPVSPYRLADSRAATYLLRLEAGRTTEVPIGGPGDVAVSINVTIDRPAGPGFLSVQGADAALPITSTVNFLDLPAANHVIAPIEDGRIGVHASVDTDVIIDVNGFFREGGGHGVVPTPPGRVLDTRTDVALRPGEQRVVPVVGVPGGAPAGAGVVSLNLTVVGAEGPGHLTARPSGPDRVDISNVNVAAGETRPNSTLVAVGDDGTITLESSVTAHVLVDVTGYLVPPDADGMLFTPMAPIRVLDTRAADGTNVVTAAAPLAAGTTARLQLAGHRGIPADTRAVWVNVTAVDAAAAGYVSVVPRGAVVTTSTLNTDPTSGAVANGALVSLGDDGAIEVHVDHDVHVLVDLTGVWR